MPTCPACRIDYEDGKRFCKVCGQELVLRDPPMHCPRCDVDYEPGKKFCKTCGAPLAPTTSPEPGKEAAPPRMSPRPSASRSAPRLIRESLSTDEPASTPKAASHSQAGAPPEERPRTAARRKWLLVASILMMVVAGSLFFIFGEYLSRRGMRWLRFSRDDDFLATAFLLVAVLLSGGAFVVFRRWKRSR